MLDTIDPLLEGTKKRSRKPKSTKKDSAQQKKQTSSIQTLMSSSAEIGNKRLEIPEGLEEQENVIFKPNPGPQTAFLAASERETIYGGAAGSGKSFAILADPLRYITHPQFSGLILRHTTEELRELVWKSQELYPKIIPSLVWSERKMQWQHPNGGRLWMSYLDRDEDVLRYQGLSFCVAEKTQVARADGTFTPIEDISVGDEVATLEGSNKVVFKSERLQKKCVRVDIYSSDGVLLSSQIQPHTHPIALLSSKPLKSWGDWYQRLDTLLTSPVQWLSFEHVQSAFQENQGFSSLTKDGQSYCKESVDDNQGDQQLPSLFFPVVLHGQVRQSSAARASTQSHTFCKSSLPLLGSNQYLPKSSLGRQRLDECAQLHTGHNTAEHCRTCNDDAGALPATEIAEDSTTSCLTYSRQCDAQLLCETEYVPHVSLKQDDVELHNRNGYRAYGKGYTQQYIQYRSSYYVHPYTKEQRRLEVPVELGFVRFVPIDDPFCNVYDLTVDECNHYTTFGGIINRNCWIAFDELTQWGTPFAWNYMRSRLRSAATDLPVFMRATTNPGNAGHGWVKKMFIDPAPPGQAFWATDIDTGETLTYPKGHDKEGQPLFKRRFIPATLKDNPYLYSNGDYEAMLLSLPETQRRQLLYGDWDIAEGAAFPEFKRNVHVVEPYRIPSDWPRFRACDYGYGSWSAVLWFAVAPDESLVVYRELYVTKVLAEDLAVMVLNAEEGEKIRYGVLDSSTWHKRGDTGPSIAERMILKGCKWRPSDRSAGSRISGKNELHRRLQIDEFTDKPRITIFNTCTNLISQLPLIPLDKNNPEDIDVKYANDHIYDALRYGIMSRPRSKSVFDFDENHRQGFVPACSKFGY